MYLVEEVELLVNNRMAWGHEKGHRQVEGLHNTYNAYNFCNSLVIKLYTKCACTTQVGFSSAARTCLFSLITAQNDAQGASSVRARLIYSEKYLAHFLL
jgi:hypothetical protein